MEESYDGTASFWKDERITLSNFIDEWVEATYDKFDDMFIKQSEKEIADAVLTLFKTRHDLEIFKKKALYIYIREMTDCETPSLTKVISTLKEDFREKYMVLHEQGLITNKPL